MPMNRNRNRQNKKDRETERETDRRTDGTRLPKLSKLSKPRRLHYLKSAPGATSNARNEK